MSDDELGLVSAIWILASNDENPLITYAGIRNRLGLCNDSYVKTIVQKRRELFRLGAPQDQVDAWKARLKEGKGMPSWLNEITDLKQRAKAIDDLSPKDVFRSQFRTTSGAKRSPIEIITWGLEHLDRRQKARLAARDVSAKSWQVWLVFGTSFLGILVQLFKS